MHFLFISNQSDQSFLRYGQNSVWPWEKHIQNFDRKFAKITVFNRTFLKSNQVMSMNGAIALQCVIFFLFCSDRMSGSHFIVQTSSFVLIHATAVTLCQGHGMIIQHILPDLFILCSKYLRCSSNGFDVRGKILVAWPQCVCASRPRDACMRHQTRRSSVLIIVCRLLGAKPLSEPILAYCQLDHWVFVVVNFESKSKQF